MEEGKEQAYQQEQRKGAGCQDSSQRTQSFFAFNTILELGFSLKRRFEKQLRSAKWGNNESLPRPSSSTW